MKAASIAPVDGVRDEALPQPVADEAAWRLLRQPYEFFGELSTRPGPIKA
jgi:hypothetical protein